MQNQHEPTLVELIRYNNWANAQVFAACQNLAAGQLDAAAPGAYGTIRDTIEHVIRAEADYIGRLTGSRPQPTFRWGTQAPVTDLITFANSVADALLETIQTVSPDHMVHEEEDGNTIDYKAMLLFIQVINHGIEHRTNITTILSGLGLPAPEVDGWGYLFAHPQTFALKETSKESPNANPQS